MNRRILWIIPKWTFPINDGARVATDSLIRTTIAAGAQVDVLCLHQPLENVNLIEMRDHWKVNEIFLMPRTLPMRKWAKVFYYVIKFIKAPLFPLTLSSFAEHRLRTATSEIIAKNNYHQIVLDGLHLGALFFEGHAWKHPGPQVILRAHNIEAELWKRAALEKKNAVLKCVLNWQKKCVEKVEKTIAESVNGIAAISEEDAESFKLIAPLTPLRVIPLGLNFTQPLAAPESSGLNFLFIGRLDWAPNRDGLEWILRDVWPHVHKRRPLAKLKIVGSGDRSWLSSYAKLPGVEMVGFVKDIREAYESCHFTITPLTYGSGTRIKVVESFAMNRALISTRMGVQGAYLDESNYINAETTEEWINILSTVEWNEITASRLMEARQKISRILDESQIGITFYTWLNTLK